MRMSAASSSTQPAQCVGHTGSRQGSNNSPPASAAPADTQGEATGTLINGVNCEGGPACEAAAAAATTDGGAVGTPRTAAAAASRAASVAAPGDTVCQVTRHGGNAGDSDGSAGNDTDDNDDGAGSGYDDGGANSCVDDGDVEAGGGGGAVPPEPDSLQRLLRALRRMQKQEARGLPLPRPHQWQRRRAAGEGAPSGAGDSAAAKGEEAGAGGLTRTTSRASASSLTSSASSRGESNAPIGTTLAGSGDATRYVVLQEELIGPRHIKLALAFIYAFLLVSMAALIFLTVTKLAKSERYLWDHYKRLTSFNIAIATVSLFLNGGALLFAVKRIVQVQRRGLVWAARRRNIVRLLVFESAVQVVNSTCYLVPNVMIYIDPCNWTNSGLHFCGPIRWWCWSILWVSSLAHIHNLVPLGDEGITRSVHHKGVLKIAQRTLGLTLHVPRHWREMLPKSLRFPIVQDLSLWVHWPKLLLWVPVAGCILASGIHVMDVEDRWAASARLSILSSDTQCIAGYKCSLDSTLVTLVIIIMGFFVFFTVLYMLSTLWVRHELALRNYVDYRSPNVVLLMQIRNRFTVFSLLGLSVVLLFFIDAGSCNSLMFAWLGFPPMQLIAGSSFALVLYANTPTMPKATTMEMAALQQVAWREPQSMPQAAGPAPSSVGPPAKPAARYAAVDGAAGAAMAATAAANSAPPVPSCGAGEDVLSKSAAAAGEREDNAARAALRIVGAATGDVAVGAAGVAVGAAEMVMSAADMAAATKTVAGMVGGAAHGAATAEEEDEPEGPPVFCWENALRLYVWCSLIYNIEENPACIFTIDMAMSLFGCTEYELLWDRDASNSRDTKGILAWGPGVMVVAFRGTASKENVITDIQVWQSVHLPKRTGARGTPRVHKGFYDAWVGNGYSKRVVDRITEIVAADVAARSGAGDSGGMGCSHAAVPYRIYCTGHSLGGALSTLAAYDITQACRPLCRLRLANYTFGCPYTGNVAFAKDFDTAVPNCWHVINDRDIIPQSGKLVFLYKRSHLRSVIHPNGDLIVQPSVLERNTFKGLNVICSSASVGQHLLANYNSTMTAVMRKQFTTHGLPGGRAGMLSMLRDPVMGSLLRLAFGADPLNPVNPFALPEADDASTLRQRCVRRAADAKRAVRRVQAGALAKGAAGGEADGGEGDAAETDGAEVDGRV